MAENQVQNNPEVAKDGTPASYNLRPRKVVPKELKTRKRQAGTLRQSKRQKTTVQSPGVPEDRLSSLEILIQEQEKLFLKLKEEIHTHTEALQGLMQVVSSPQNLANFQQQYAYSQLSTNQNANVNTSQPPIVYYPVYTAPMAQPGAAPVVAPPGAAPVIAPPGTPAPVVIQPSATPVAAATPSPKVIVSPETNPPENANFEKKSD